MKNYWVKSRSFLENWWQMTHFCLLLSIIHYLRRVSNSIRRDLLGSLEAHEWLCQVFCSFRPTFISNFPICSPISHFRHLSNLHWSFSPYSLYQSNQTATFWPFHPSFRSALPTISNAKPTFHLPHQFVSIGAFSPSRAQIVESVSPPIECLFLWP